MVKTFESLVLSKYWTLTGKLFSVLLVSILITGVARADSAPVADTDVASTDEDTAVEIDVLANDGDPDGDSLEILAAVVSDPDTGEVAIAEDGLTITFTPATNYYGTASIIYIVTDNTDGSVSSSHRHRGPGQ